MSDEALCKYIEDFIETYICEILNVNISKATNTSSKESLSNVAMMSVDLSIIRIQFNLITFFWLCDHYNLAFIYIEYLKGRGWAIKITI